MSRPGPSGPEGNSRLRYFSQARHVQQLHLATLDAEQVDSNMEKATLSGQGLWGWVFYDVTVTAELN